MIVKIGFAKNKNWWAIFGWLIRLVDFKPASHCYIELVTTHGPWIVESVYPQGRILHKDRWSKNYETVYEFEFGTSQPEEDIFAWAEMFVKNKEYSLFQNIIIGFTILFNNSLRKLEFQEINGRRSQNCTEVVAHFMEDWLNVDWEESLDNVSINELYQLVRRIAWEKSNGPISNN